MGVLGVVIRGGEVIRDFCFGGGDISLLSPHPPPPGITTGGGGTIGGVPCARGFFFVFFFFLAGFVPEGVLREKSAYRSLKTNAHKPASGRQIAR